MAAPAALGRLAVNEARTVTTGHQLCLAGGPAFVVYKVLDGRAHGPWLEARWGSPVVPVFWLAFEDHDFDEIQWALGCVWSGTDGKERSGHRVPSGGWRRTARKTCWPLGGLNRSDGASKKKPPSPGRLRQSVRRRCVNGFHEGA